MSRPTTEATYSPRTHHALADRTTAILPPLFFAPAALWFALALGAAPFVVSDLLEHYYQPRVLAVTHAITLGWLSAAMLGVLYRYLPALVKTPLPAPRLALAQWAAFLVGAAGLIVHLWLGAWVGAAISGALLAASAWLVCANLWPLLRAAPRRGVAEVGIFAGTAFFAVAATLGALLALHKTLPLLGGGMLTNLAAHAHLAGVGWVGIVVCALSYRFLPAFLMPEYDGTAAARRLVLVLAALVAAFAVATLGRSAWAPSLGVAIAAAVLAHALLAARVVASRQLPFDWTAWHAIASLLWCGVAASGGAATAAWEPTPLADRLAAAYVIAGLLGWFSNLLIGVSYKLFPAFALAARSELGRAAVPIAALALPESLRPLVFALFNLGLAVAVAGVLAASAASAVAGSALLAIAGATYGAFTLRTMAYVVVEPPPSSDPLAIVP